MNLDLITKSELVEEVELLRSLNQKLWKWIESQTELSRQNSANNETDWRESFVDNILEFD